VRGFPFVGCLFSGYMITKNGPRVLEYNVRFGDPETQSLLPLLESDLAKIMLACTNGRLAEIELKVSKESAATVVVAAGGYPDSYKKGIPMTLDPVPPCRCPQFPRVLHLTDARCNALPRWHCCLARRARAEHLRRPCHCGNCDRSDTAIGHPTGIRGCGVYSL
jgi:Phosphoribosylglycinamide synthetase, ATP-grasp (A) domain